MVVKTDNFKSLIHFSGFVGIVVYVAFTLLSIALFPGSFNPLNHWLSDLGASSFNPRGAVFYNVGMIVTGLAFVVFIIGIKRWQISELRRKRLFQCSRVMGFLSSFGLILAGVFSEDYPIEHQVASLILFISILIFLILVSVSLLSHPRFLKAIGYYGFVVASINFALLFLALSTPYSTYLVEWLTVFAALGYVALLTYNTEKLRRTMSSNKVKLL